MLDIIIENLYQQEYNEDKERTQALLNELMLRYIKIFPTLEDRFLINLLVDSMEMPKEELTKKYKISRSHIFTTNKKTIEKLKLIAQEL